MDKLWSLLGPQAERKKKAILKIFKDFGPRITIQANLWIVIFLDAQLNLDPSTPDNNPVYINKNSSHPATVLK